MDQIEKIVQDYKDHMLGVNKLFCSSLILFDGTSYAGKYRLANFLYLNPSLHSFLHFYFQLVHDNPVLSICRHAL